MTTWDKKNLSCCTAVGQFLQSWSLLEADINGTIAEALQLNQLQAVILLTNAQFRDKLHILKCAIDSSTLNEDKKNQYITTMNNLARFSENRNMVAHTAFCPDENTVAVRFLRIKAKGKIDFPEEVWSPSKFKEYFKKMESYGETLEAIRHDIKRAANMKVMAELLLQPTLNNDETGSPNFLYRPSRTPQDSSPPATTEETSSQTPPASEE